MKRTITFLCLIGNLYAQNWTPVNLSDKYNYKLGDAEIISHTIWVDSVDVIYGDSVFYLNRIVTPCDTCPDDIAETGSNCWENCFYLENQPQFLQRKIKKDQNGVYHFLDTNQFMIKVNAEENETWNFTDEIEATVVEKTIFSLFEDFDYVKRIELSNGQSIILSENYGIIQFPDLTNQIDHYHLAGIEGRNVGEHVPDFRDFYDFEIGDVYEYYMSSFSPDKYDWWGGNKFTILDKTIRPDTIIYEIEGYEFDRYGPYPHVYYPEYYSKTLVFVDSVNHFLNQYNNQLLSMCFNQNGFCYLENEVFSFLKIEVNENELMSKRIGTDWSDSEPLLIRSEEYKDLLVPSLDEYIYFYVEKYAENLGMTLSDIMYFESGETTVLYGYIKNLDTVGTITPDSLLWPDLIDEVKESVFNIYPNPAEDHLFINAKDFMQIEYIEVLNRDGKLIRKEKVGNKNSFVLDISSLPNGIYILRIYSGRNIYTSKLSKI